MIKNNLKVVVRGGGDLATAVIQKLYRCGFDIVVCEINAPKSVRRTVSLSSAVYEGVFYVEDMKGVLVHRMDEIEQIWEDSHIPIVVERESELMAFVRPDVFIDATLSKKTVNYDKSYAPIVIGLGPEIEAGINAHVVIETDRGHDLGRLIFEGFASPNTHEPGNIEGFKTERVLRAPCSGKLSTYKKIGDSVSANEVLAVIRSKSHDVETEVEVTAPISGIIRGLIHESVPIKKGQKIGDVDPRNEAAFCYSISDKGRNIAGGVIEAIYYLL